MSKTLLLALSVLICSVGCTDAEWSAFSALGNRHHITMYSGGKVVAEWTSTGKIENEAHSDGFYFKDEKTGRMVSVTGDVVIEVLP